VDDKKMKKPCPKAFGTACGFASEMKKKKGDRNSW
jgi:hypothetical protein